MIIEVDVKRAEQSWDLDTKKQQNYLVIEFCGIETRVPCTEEELERAIAELSGAVVEDEPVEEGEPEPRPAPSTFVRLDQAAVPEPAPTEAPRRRLAPMQRERGDDVGIAQG